MNPVLILIVAIIAGVNADLIDDRMNYTMYTREQPYTPIDINSFQPALPWTEDRKLALIIPGWDQTRETVSIIELKDAILRHKNTYYDVIIVDWSALAKSDIEKNVEEAGRKVGVFIQAAAQRNSIPYAQFELFAFDFGAHVAAFAGRQLNRATDVKPSRILALEPTALIISPSKRLNKDDADYVTVVHTSLFGMTESVGDADFFLNGGIFQKDCIKLEPVEGAVRLACHHFIVLNFFIAALDQPENYMGTLCSSYAKFQQNVCKDQPKFSLGDLRQKADGDFYLDTPSKQ